MIESAPLTDGSVRWLWPMHEAGRKWLTARGITCILRSMTKQEIICRQREMERFGNKRMIGWLVFFFGVIFSGWPLSSYIERHEELTWIGPVLGICLFVFLLGNVALMLWFTKYQQRRFGISCPSCGKSIIGFDAKIAIATGNCGQCGARIFNDTNS